MTRTEVSLYRRLVNPDGLLKRYPYLADHSDRCRSVLVFYPVLRLLSRLFGEDIAEANRGFSLAMAILSYICECMLTGRVGATHRELLDEIAPLARAQSEAEGRSASRGETEALVGRVINELQNSGEIFRADFFDYARGELVPHSFRIVESVASRDRGAYKIKLTSEGIDLFFRLREVYGALGTDMERLFLEHQIRRGCYADAERVIDTLLLKVGLALERHRDVQGKLRSNPREVTAQEIQYFGEEVAGRLVEEKAHFAQIREVVTTQIQGLMKAWKRSGSRDPTVQANLAAVRRVQTGVARIVDRHTVLLGLSTELRREFRRLKLGLLTFAQPLRRVPFEVEVFDRVLRRQPPLPSEELHAFVGPTFGHRPPRLFHLAHALPPAPRQLEPKGEAFFADPWADPEWLEGRKRAQSRQLLHLRTLLHYLASCDEGVGTLEGLEAHDAPERPVLDEEGRPAGAEPACLMDMDEGEVRGFLRFLLGLHNRREIDLRGPELRESLEELVAESPDWEDFRQLRVTARPGLVRVQGNRIRPLDFELLRREAKEAAHG